MPPVVDRSSPPASGPIRPFSFPEVDSDRLDNGLLLRFGTKAELPMVSIALVMDAGEARALDGLAGVAVLAGDALEAGTALRGPAAFSEALERIGADLAISTGWDSTVVSVTCMPERLEGAFRLLSEMILTPAFEEAEFGRIHAQALAGLEQRRMSPAALADDSALGVLYDSSSPYARPLPGTPTTLESVGRADVVRFARDQHRPGGSGLVVIGDVERSEALDLAERFFGPWIGEGRARGPVPADAGFEERVVHVFHRPGAVQSEIRVGHVGVARDTEDYFPLRVFNLILGGAFTSRLNLNLREKNGFTYGVRSRFRFRRGPGPFLVSTAVGTEVTEGAVRETVSEIERLVREGPTEEEVSSARDYIAGVFPLQLETTGQLAARVGELIVYGLPDDYWATYRDRVRSVDREAAGEAGRRNVRPDNLAVVVVGDADEIAGPLEGLQLGPVVVHRTESTEAGGAPGDG